MAQLVGGGDRRAIRDHLGVGEFDRAIGIDGAVAAATTGRRDRDGAAAQGDRAVGVDAIRTGGDGERAAADRDQ